MSYSLEDKEYSKHGVEISNSCINCLIWRQSKRLSNSLRLCRRIRMPVSKNMVCKNWEEDSIKIIKQEAGWKTALTLIGYEE